MPVLKYLVALLSMFCAASAFAGQSEDAPIYVTRHYDTPAGQPDPDLLPQGKARAEKLAAWFYGRTLKAIYVSDFKRTRQTAAPLAAMLDVAVETYDPKDTPAIVARARAARGPVLIVGHSNTVPDIVAQLGGKRPGELKHEDFGDLWTIENGSSEHTKIDP
ncbi:histidine phosphatase family protein [Sphingomonas sp. BT-65]|uniref:histidine phosphatase family protein n=1 Tax=Sphingomonas sp. BT-65 TaxID=2989821 RepID=UPI0022360B02|nr:histidine phosphatase family protein [Sphingomonas sp. BT-65]MCW4460138.1 histidine phosphatase family protein [Sphingomonas sp. BT-65]